MTEGNLEDKLEKAMKVVNSKPTKKKSSSNEVSSYRPPVYVNDNSDYWDGRIKEIRKIRKEIKSGFSDSSFFDGFAEKAGVALKIGAIGGMGYGFYKTIHSNFLVPISDNYLSIFSKTLAPAVEDSITGLADHSNHGDLISLVSQALSNGIVGGVSSAIAGAVAGLGFAFSKYLLKDGYVSSDTFKESAGFTALGGAIGGGLGSLFAGSEGLMFGTYVGIVGGAVYSHINEF